MLCCVLCCGVCAVWCGVWCVWCGTLKTPCVHSKRARVYVQNVSVCTGTTRTCVSTWKNFNKRYVLSGFVQEQRIDMENVHDIVDEGSHPPWARFLGEFGSPQEYKNSRTPRMCSTSLKNKEKNILKKF